MFRDLGRVFSSPIGRKGVILVTIPLVFSIIFILTLRHLLHEASQAADREARSRETVNLANKFGADMIKVGAAYYIARISGNRESFLSKVDQLRHEFNDLELKLATNKARRKLLVKTRASLEELFDLLQNRWEKNMLLKRRSLIDGLKHLETSNRVQELLNTILQDMNAIVNDEKRRLKRSPVSSESYRSSIDVLLLAGVAANFGLALALIAYFSNSITRRLSVVSDNSRRLADEKELNPAISGADEIASLDRSFHDMAEKLTEARSRERAVLDSLRLSEDRLRSMLDTIPLGLVVVDAEDKVGFLSPSAEELFGYKKEEFAGRRLAELFGAASAQGASSVSSGCADSSASAAPASSSSSASSAAAAASASVSNFALPALDARIPREVQAERKDGSRFPAELLGTEFHSADSDGRLLIVSDITQKYEMERLKQSFVSMVSHELRSPLMSIQTYLKMLSKGHFGSLNEDGARSLQMAEKSIVRLIALVNEILDVERLESGTIKIDKKETSVDEILELSGASVAALAQAKSINLIISGLQCRLYADKDRIVQVIVNLVSNAIKFSEAGSEVKIEAQEQDEFLQISVIDRGRGIPLEHQDLIFQRFHQVNKSDASEKGGTGLGLAISRAIVEAHQGQMGVESRPGEGSRFWFRLPLDELETD